MNELENYQEKTFDNIKHINEFGYEYWEARELMNALGYSKWGNFKKVIDKAKITCDISNNKVSDHFADVGKMVQIGSNAERTQESYNLSRYACYLIVQNADPRKKTVALGQTYFAIQTRRMELTEEEISKLSEDERRLYTRINITNKNKLLAKTAKNAEVEIFDKFNNYGYMGLYNGETAKQIANRKKISEKEDILDWMGSTELAANLFRITQTEDVLTKKNIKNEENACSTHFKVGKSIRNTIEEIGGTMPEDLPTPNKSIKELEAEELNKLINSN